MQSCWVRAAFFAAAVALICPTIVVFGQSRPALSGLAVRLCKAGKLSPTVASGSELYQLLGLDVTLGYLYLTLASSEILMAPKKQCADGEPTSAEPFLIVMFHRVSEGPDTISGAYYLTSTRGILIRVVHSFSKLGKETQFYKVELDPKVVGSFEIEKNRWISNQN